MSLAALKRRIRVGTRLTVEAHSNPRAAAIVGVTRTVEAVQQNAVALTSTDGGPPSWLYWPPAKEVEMIDAHRFAVSSRGTRIVYRITSTGSMASVVPVEQGVIGGARLPAAYGEAALNEED